MYKKLRMIAALAFNICMCQKHKTTTTYVLL